MSLPKGIEFVSFDVYGSLIDWDTGIYDAFAAEAKRDGFTVEREQLIPLFHKVRREIQEGSYELFAEVLRRTAVQVASEIGWSLEPSRASFLPDSIPRWRPFPDAKEGLERISKKYRMGLVSNVDDKLLGQTRRHFNIDFDLVVTAQQVRAYKPEPSHFKELARRIGGKKGWVHVGQSYYHDMAPCIKMKVSTIWLNRSDSKLVGKKPSAQASSMTEVAELLGV